MGDPKIRCVIFCKCFLNGFLLSSVPNPATFILTTKKRPTLKSRYKGRVQAATEYAKTIEDFDDLVDPWTLARHFLGLKPSSFVLQAIQIEEEISLLGRDHSYHVYLVSC